jgi:hypothetical protein
MSDGPVTVGRLALHEDNPAVLSISSAGAGSLKGVEYTPPLTADELRRWAEDVRGLGGALVPVIFGDRPEQDAYYGVVATNTDVTQFSADVLTLAWSADVTRYGGESEVDLESRLSGPVTRETDFAVTGERWHAPPIGHYGYWTGNTVPSAVTRAGADGAMVVYRDVPAGVSPRWGCPPADYLAGRVRFLDDTGRERTGVGFTVSAASWELSNGLVRVAPGGGAGVFDVAAYTGGGWRVKSWVLSLNGTPFSLPSSVTVLREAPHVIVVRVLFDAAPGRFAVDVTLRRGSRFAEFYVQSTTAGTLRIGRTATEAGTTGTGYVRATANDADGNRYIVGSAHTHTDDLTNGGISRAATAVFDAFVGVIAAGSGAVPGDQAADLFEQYLGAPGELVAAVRR